MEGEKGGNKEGKGKNGNRRGEKKLQTLLT